MDATWRQRAVVALLALMLVAPLTGASEHEAAMDGDGYHSPAPPTPSTADGSGGDAGSAGDREATTQQSDTFWELSGNAGTSPPVDFLGTTDDNRLVVKVNNQQAYEFVPTAGTPNVEGGHVANTVTSGVQGATISGGGESAGSRNEITDDQGVIGGGVGNVAGNEDGDTTNAIHAVVGGGFFNSASARASTVAGGRGNTANALTAAVGGGQGNTASGVASAIAGGKGNTASGNFATVAGGNANSAGGSRGTVGGGASNMASGNFATIAGGRSNVASGLDSAVLSGEANLANNEQAVVAGGFNNGATGFNSFIGGGQSNQATSFAASVVGGDSNTASGPWSAAVGGIRSTASGLESFVGAGEDNTASNNRAAVLGGLNNTANGSEAAVAGGLNNVASGSAAMVGGGQNNEASGILSHVAGGENNRATAQWATVGGGLFNDATGLFSMIPGGGSNIAAGGGTFAAGFGAEAIHDGSFVWSDTSGNTMTTTSPNHFLVDAVRVGINTNTPQVRFHVKDNVDQGTNDFVIAGHVATVENTDTSGGGDVLALRVQENNPGADNNLITFFDSNEAIGAIEGNGAGGITIDTTSSDFAEYFPKADAGEEMAPGDVVALRDGALTKDTARADRVAVVTTAPMLLGNRPDPGEEAGHTAVALLGQAPVTVRGPVNAGDLLVASGGSDGAAVAVDPGAFTPDMARLLVGYALEPTTGAHDGQVRALVGTTPVDALQSLSDAVSDLEERLTRLEAQMAQGE